MNILKKIVANKIQEVESLKEIQPIKLLEQSIYFESTVVSMKAYLNRADRMGIIAEIKRAAPSTGALKRNIDIESLSIGYMQAGATALSILTDKTFFSGSTEDLTTARKYNYCPILRKDFVIDEYQLIESKSIGADCILLIAACLTKERCKELARMAHALGLEVLLEVHDEFELNDFLNEHIDLVGVNNRNLIDFTTDIDTSIKLSNLIPSDMVKISESGISKAEQIQVLKEVGYQGFLIGTSFMRHAHPELACQQLISELKSVGV